MRLLIVEDEAGLADTLQEILRDERYEADVASDGEEGYYMGKSGIYDMIILDGMLPKMDGYDILKKWRAEKISVPVLMLTARSELGDKLKGLNLGADDYLTKPFEMEELLARIRVVLRRQGELNMDLLEYGDLQLELTSGMLKNQVNEETVQLGKKEFQLLELFMRSKKQIVTREQIVEKLWGYDCEAEYNNVEVYISFTRRKLKFIHAKTVIRAVRGVGYRLEGENG